MSAVPESVVVTVFGVECGQWRQVGRGPDTTWIGYRGVTGDVLISVAWSAASDVARRDARWRVHLWTDTPNGHTEASAEAPTLEEAEAALRGMIAPVLTVERDEVAS